MNKRYDEINNYYYSVNNSGMDTERYIELMNDTNEIYLDKLNEQGYSSSNLFITSNGFFETIAPIHADFYSWNIVFNKKIKNQYLCDYISFSAMSLFSDYGSYEDHRECFYIPLYKQGVALLYFMSCNRLDIARYCYPFIIDGLKSASTDELRELEVQKLGVLAIEMLASENSQVIDWDSMQIPYDRFYRDFVREVLYSKDENVLVDWLKGLCDNHLKWSARSELVENESPLLGYEIAEDHQLLWPFEYQAVRNFRTKYGLSTPEIEHPLLKTPMAINHRPDFSQWKAPEWFYPLLDKLIAINPKISFVNDLFK
ncbi:Uncharacterised protein [Serratia fonticola]|uniref:hypothetical protein n=1 Tax=Serratia fonticola TaxID=47917 RepID=UPI002177F6E4|nr:hypothetical protein [Serratia fonticola]CAI1083404.1 Uncharacterised protein [Serratia fonticola]